MNPSRVKSSSHLPATHLIQRRTLLAMGFGVSLLAGCGKSAKLSAIPPGKTVLAFGDSVTFGTGAASGEDWPSLLALKSGWKVVNAGVSGDTAENGKGRIQALLTAHKPTLVVIEIGGKRVSRILCKRRLG